MPRKPQTAPVDALTPEQAVHFALAAWNENGGDIQDHELTRTEYAQLKNHLHGLRGEPKPERNFFEQGR